MITGLRCTSVKQFAELLNFLGTDLGTTILTIPAHRATNTDDVWIHFEQDVGMLRYDGTSQANNQATCVARLDNLLDLFGGHVVKQIRAILQRGVDHDAVTGCIDGGADQMCRAQSVKATPVGVATSDHESLWIGHPDGLADVIHHVECLLIRI